MGMKSKKVHGAIEKGYCYVGGNTHKSKNGEGKIGTNENDLNKRISNLMQKENFTLFAYLEFSNTSKAKIEIIESAMRVGLAEHYQHFGNDHFKVQLTKTDKYLSFCLLALYYSMEEAERRGYKYTVHWIR